MSFEKCWRKKIIVEFGFCPLYKKYELGKPLIRLFDWRGGFRNVNVRALDRECNTSNKQNVKGKNIYKNDCKCNVTTAIPFLYSAIQKMQNIL